MGGHQNHRPGMMGGKVMPMMDGTEKGKEEYPELQLFGIFEEGDGLRGTSVLHLVSLHVYVYIVQL